MDEPGDHGSGVEFQRFKTVLDLSLGVLLERHSGDMGPWDSMDNL